MFDWPAKLEPSAIHTVAALAERRPMAMQSMLCAIAWGQRGGFDMGERAELVRMLLVRLILKRVRVHGIEREACLAATSCKAT